MTATDIWMVVAIAFLLVLLAFLAVAEMGLSRMSRSKAQALAEQRGRQGRVLLRLVSQPERWVNPLLLTVNICQTVQATLTGIVAGRLFGVLGVVFGVTLNVVVFFVLAESLPKTWAVLSPERAALVTARPVAALSSFPPLRLVSSGLIGLSNVLVRGKGLAEGPFVSEQELLALADAAVEGEVIEHEERQLIESIIEFGDTVAREVMVPRPDMVTVAATATVSHALGVAIDAGFSRLPVVGEGLDDVLGVVYAKDLMRAEREGRGADTVASLQRTAKFVPETKPVSHLMREMQAEKVHQVLLVDEYGGIAGLVTLEDCLEELVGDIVDEYDVEGEEVEQLPGGELRVSGGMGIDDLSERIGVSLPAADWDTVAGFVFGTLGHVPDVGESVDFDGYRFVADQLDGRRIEAVRVAPIPGWAPPAREDDDDD